MAPSAQDMITERSAELDELNGLISEGNVPHKTSDPEWQGRSLKFILTRFRYVMVRETVSDTECGRRMSLIEKKLEAHAKGCPGALFFERPSESARVILAKAAGTHFPWIIVFGLVGFIWWMLK